jgi:hypothetical protein
MAFFGIIEIICIGIILFFIILLIFVLCYGKINETYRNRNTINTFDNNMPIILNTEVTQNISITPVTLTTAQRIANRFNNTEGVMQIVIDSSLLKYIKEFDLECNICMEYGTEGNSNFVETQCGHKYHTECLNKWINTNHFDCPTCRQSLKSGKNLATHNNLIQNEIV